MHSFGTESGKNGLCVLPAIELFTRIREAILNWLTAEKAALPPSIARSRPECWQADDYFHRAHKFVFCKRNFVIDLVTRKVVLLLRLFRAEQRELSDVGSPHSLRL